jgi:hypothetical protein
MEKYQTMLQGPMLLAFMAIGPLADFNANVLQKLTFLQVLDIKFPMTVEMFLTLVGNLGNTSTGETFDDTSTEVYASSTDEMIDLTKKDQEVGIKFKLKGMTPILVRGGLMP